MIATPREASGPASGGSIKIFAGGSLASGMTPAGRHLLLALCAADVNAHNNMANSSRAPLDLACSAIFIFAPFFVPIPDLIENCIPNARRASFGFRTG
jgi:hypothetical protein